VLGAHTALKHGSKFVRVVFIAVVITLIVKTGADAWMALDPFMPTADPTPISTDPDRSR
jgi:hypothetical protein